MINYWLNRVCEFWKDKKLAEKCGLKVGDICVHEYDGNIYMTFEPYNFPDKYKCKKCGVFYAEKLLRTIENQQPEELKEIT